MKTASARSPTVLMAAAVVSALMAGPGAADSIGTVYNMDRMLFEPHPLADQYGTRWQAPPVSEPGRLLGIPAPILLPTPSPFLSPQPGTAPEPPPTTFAPPEPPPFGKTAPPPPQPAPRPQPVAKVAPPQSIPETTPPPTLEMSPRLSIDAEGVKPMPAKVKRDVSEEGVSEGAGSERQFEQSGERPPLPPG